MVYARLPLLIARLDFDDANATALQNNALFPIQWKQRIV